ncbi:MAG: type II and III secretion system protein family protein [Proteobacteria bacterium]|nr:type II and III secretion system protein family protein [Pseudomonadota bacterium]
MNRFFMGRFSIRNVLVLLAVAQFAVPQAALAQQGVDAGIEMQELIDDTVPYVITLSVGKTRLVNLPVDASTVLTANPEIIDLAVESPRTVFLIAQAVGDTNVFFLDSEGRVVLRLEVRVEVDMTALRKALAEILPNETIEVTAVNTDIVLTGTVRSAKASEDARRIARRFVAEDENVVNMLSVLGGQQVFLQVRVAEVRRDIIKQLGIDLTLGLTRTENIGFDLTTSVPTVSGFTVASVNAFGTGTFVFDSGPRSLTTIIKALESEGLVKNLAEPSLTAVSGETAKLVAGGEFPVLIPGAEPGTFTIEFKQFGIGLAFTPVVLESGRISLKVSTEVSALSTSGELTIRLTENDLATIPALTLRRAETTVELPSGGSLVIAGLLQDDIVNTVTGIPGLMNLPILGALFRSQEFQRNETELIIIVTAYLVEPVAERALALPTDGFAPASDVDMYLFGRLHKIYVKPDLEPPAGQIEGPVGYIME